MGARWDERYGTGHAELDRQHRALFEMVGQLGEAIVERRGQATAARLLERLGGFAESHFATEERLMRWTFYPAMSRHVAAHRGLRKRLGELLAGYSTGELVLPLTLCQFLMAWLDEHLRGEDQELAAWLRAARAAERDAAAG